MLTNAIFILYFAQAGITPSRSWELIHQYGITAAQPLWNFQVIYRFHYRGVETPNLCKTMMYGILKLANNLNLTSPMDTRCFCEILWRKPFLGHLRKLFFLLLLKLVVREVDHSKATNMVVMPDKRLDVYRLMCVMQYNCFQTTYHMYCLAISVLFGYFNQYIHCLIQNIPLSFFNLLDVVL